MTEYWQNMLAEVWGIKAELQRLDGEYDLNFMAESMDGSGYVLKVMRVGCETGLVDVQLQALNHIRQRAPEVPVPAVIPTSSGALFAEIPDAQENTRLVWLLERLAGGTFASFTPKTPELMRKLGQHIGAMDAALAGYKHPFLDREFKWELPSGGWIAEHLNAVSDTSRKKLLAMVLNDFQAVLPLLDSLPSFAIHNDVNDYNILVTPSLDTRPQISGIIDLGDMASSPRICELAIAGAYAVLDHDTPEALLSALVAGYHDTHPLTASEVDLIWPLLRMRLAVSIVNSTLESAENSADPYVTVSQAPAWRFLEGNTINPGLLRARLRVACGLPVTDGAAEVLEHLDNERGSFAPLFGEDLSGAPRGALSVAESTWPQDPFDLPHKEAAQVGEEYENDGKPWLGLWGEPRLIYTAPAFRLGPWKASNRRTVHLGVDVFLPSGTPLFTPLDGTVEVVENRTDHLDYGGVLILRHATPGGAEFFTLFGHLDPEVCQRLQPGDTIVRGEEFCRLGTPAQNGGWSSHVHFQLALTTDGMGHDWPGVADPDEMALWGAVCPNPAALLNLPDENAAYQPMDKPAILADRQAHFGRNVKLSYADPVMFLRGWKHHLFDEWGRPYLDAYNNVPHVGHAHPRIQAIAADQLKRMNSNTRYLHPAQTAFAEKVLSKMPEHLSVCFFVNSGTEANELALRLARAHTGGRDMITPDQGYHGNTTGAVDVSAYKFNKPGGGGQPDWVHLVEVADDYRGSFRQDDPDRARKYAELVDDALERVSARSDKLAGWIAETFPSVGGQIIPPGGYLPLVYQKIRAADGVCIADEVQTGLGRLGDYYFGFEQQDALPDIVVLGKPIGNGHPLGVLVTTAEIAESFAKGPEYFSTFGGSTLSCRTGREVLQIVDDEGLQENAQAMGGRLLAGLREMQARHPVIGDVRGFGLFIGVELVKSRETLEPATDIADYVLNRLRQERILVGTEGPADNILKIRPPLCVDSDGVEMILSVLDRVLGETAVADS
ncbi:MAG: aminotransferase class III-fold pyridoxal phosphate-dependent enzyme [Rhodobacteraceae bacterium]|nr:aminotransferase class III-fold pyridoxal phosphate-dependent enzyme [Paracoccaceae bacterium]